MALALVVTCIAAALLGWSTHALGSGSPPPARRQAERTGEADPIPLLSDRVGAGRSETVNPPSVAGEGLDSLAGRLSVPHLGVLRGEARTLLIRRIQQERSGTIRNLEHLSTDAALPARSLEAGEFVAMLKYDAAAKLIEEDWYFVVDSALGFLPKRAADHSLDFIAFQMVRGENGAVVDVIVPISLARFPDIAAASGVWEEIRHHERSEGLEARIKAFNELPLDERQRQVRAHENVLRSLERLGDEFRDGSVDATTYAKRYRELVRERLPAGMAVELDGCRAKRVATR